MEQRYPGPAHELRFVLQLQEDQRRSCRRMHAEEVLYGRDAAGLQAGRAAPGVRTCCGCRCWCRRMPLLPSLPLLPMVLLLLMVLLLWPPLPQLPELLAAVNRAVVLSLVSA